LIFGAVVVGGFGAVFEESSSLPGYVSMTFTHNVASGKAESYGFVTIISTMAWGLGYFACLIFF